MSAVANIEQAHAMRIALKSHHEQTNKQTNTNNNNKVLRLIIFHHQGLFVNLAIIAANINEKKVSVCVRHLYDESCKNFMN